MRGIKRITRRERGKKEVGKTTLLKFFIPGQKIVPGIFLT